MAKTKNVKVRAKDLKAGKRVYIAHPVHGIVEYVVKSKPYWRSWRKGLTSAGGAWWVHMCNVEYSLSYDKSCNDKHSVYSKSLADAGISVGDGKHVDYNGRRTFFKRKHAEEWVKKWSTEPSYIKSSSSNIKLLF